MGLRGRIGIVTKRPGWYGRAVQMFTGSPAFHTFIAISDTECVAATAPSVVVVPIADYDGIVWLDAPEIKLEGVARFAEAQVGKPYAYLDIFFILVTIATHWHTPAWITRRLSSPARWFCSELCDAALLQVGVNLFPDRPDCAVTPADFLRVARATR